MLDEQGKQNFFQQMDELWIQPELKKRFGTTSIPEDFKIWEALIKLPSGCPAIVEFNSEIQWELKFKAPSDIEVKAGQKIHLHELENVEHASPPTVDGHRVAFVYLYWTGYSYGTMFDFSPNHSDFDAQTGDFRLGVAIADHVRAKLIENTVRLSKNASHQLRQIGLWIAIPLIPYPLSKIIERIGTDKPDEARQILVDYCDSEFLSEKLVETWHPINVYRYRQHAFDEALQAHKNGLYHASISTLINHIEGVIVDWLHELLPPSDVTWKINSRVEQFRIVLQAIPEFEYAYREALEATIEFLQEGENAAMPFQAFKNWLDKIDPNFPSRHAHSHGKYVREIYTEENSIKLFLLLDTICQFMMFYEVRVLGRNLGESTEENEA